MTLAELQSMARFFISKDLTSSEYSDTLLNLSLNSWYRTVFGWALIASGAWEPSGEMYVTDLVDGQTEYVFPSGLVSLRRIEVKYPNATKYVKCTRFDDLSTDESIKNSVPTFASTIEPYVRLYDRSLFLYPTPTDDVTDGLYAEAVIDVTSLSGASDVPDLNPLVHRAVAIGAAMDYARMDEQRGKWRDLKEELMGVAGGSTVNTLKEQIERLAATRDRTVRQGVKARQESYR